MRIEHEVFVEAPAEAVWQLTLDVEQWPQLTPTITEVERLDGRPLEVGSRARVKQPMQRPRLWTVTRLDGSSYFEWEAKLGTIRMTGGHRVTPEGEGCRNTLSLELAGFGSGLLGRAMRRPLAKTLATENAGFKRHAERGHG